MPDISVDQEGQEKFTVGNLGFELFNIFYFEVIVYTSIKGLLLVTNGGGEKAENDSYICNWGKRKLKAGDKLEFQYLSGEKQTKPSNSSLNLEELETSKSPKVKFKIILPNGEKIICGNQNDETIQFELRWNNKSNECTLDVFSATLLDGGALDSHCWVSKKIRKGEKVTLNILDLN